MVEGILFPGQGAQFAGMGRDWADAFPAARATFADASRWLGFSLEEACWANGDRVNRTDIAQPGILVTSAAIVRVLVEQGWNPSAAPLAAGLSLGEYTALWCAGALALEDAVRLVRCRGEAMQDASEKIPSSMISLTGASAEQAHALSKLGALHGICTVANWNAPGQIVLAGELRALDVVEAGAKDVGVRRTRRLPVAGGFHSECMRPAAERLAQVLEQVEIRRPTIPVVSNVTGRAHGEPAQIRAQLAEQVCAPVLWEESMRWALSQGLRKFVEPGPGKVLAGLFARIDPEVEVLSRAAPSDLVDGGSFGP